MFGPADRHLRLLRQSLGIQITARQADLMIAGGEKNVNTAVQIIDRMQKRLIKRGSLTTDDVTFFLNQNVPSPTIESGKAITVYSRKLVSPSTKG